MSASWREMTLREAGVTLIDCDHRTPPAATEGYPYVTIPQMSGGRILLKDARLISPEHFQEWTRKTRPQANDVVLSRRCNPGETAYVSPGMEFALGQNLVLLRAEGREVTPEFLRWLVRGPEWWGQVQSFLNVGAVFDSLRCRDIPEFRLTIPPLLVQQSIAGILGALDDRIELNRKMNETLEAMARAIFKSWFIDFDPVHAKADGRPPNGMDGETAALFPDRFSNSRLGEIPEEWEATPLSNICESIISGGTPSTQIEAYWHGGIPWLSSGETRNPFIINTEKSITQLGVERSSTRLARAGATVIAGAGQGYTRGQTSLLMFDSYVNQSVVALTADKSRASDLFLFFDLSRRYDELRQLSDSHSSRGSLTTRLLGGLEIVIPPPSVLAQFDDIVEPMVNRIYQNLLQCDTLSTMRDALLPKLLCGELRIQEAEKELEAVL